MVVDVHSMPLHMESIDTNSSRCRKRKSAGRRHARENEEEVCAKEHMTHDVCECEASVCVYTGINRYTRCTHVLHDFILKENITHAIFDFLILY